MANKMTKKVDGEVLILEREFDAPRELVFQAFSQAEHLKHWWGPNGWTLSVCHIDFRPGGVWHYCMKCIDEKQGDFFGFESWGKAVYEEIVTDEKIVYTDYFSNAEGGILDGMPSSYITNSFIDQSGKTKLISHARYESPDSLQKALDMGMEQGISETYDRLEALLASLQ